MSERDLLNATEREQQWAEDTERLIDSTLGRMHYCDLCGALFMTERHLIAGSPIHRSDGDYLELPFACPECGRKTLVASHQKPDW